MGPDGKLKSYSDAYRKALARAGQSTAVDLSLTGSMMRDLKVLRISDQSVTLGWKGSASADQSLTSQGMRATGKMTDHNEIARRQQAAGRTFLDIDKAAKKNIVAWLRARLGDWFKKRAKSS